MTPGVMSRLNEPPARRILLIEDDVELRDALAEALQAKGVHVTVASDGSEGLREMRKHRPDVVVLDLMMPGMDGWQFRIAQRLEPALADTPVVALSASHSAAAAAVDADLFLQKPCGATVILDAIEEVLAIRSRREAQSKAASSERLSAIGNLAAGVSHEINNPLTAVLLLLDQARRGLRGLSTDGNAAQVAAVATLLDNARASAERIREVTQGIRTFSGLDDGPPQTLDLRQPLDAALEVVGHELRKRARLVRVDRGTPFVTAHEGRLAQVFLNLLTNAVQALPEDAAAAHEVRVTTGTDVSGRAVVEIADTGRGIAPHDLPRIFEPFFTTRPIGAGAGLGLSISHGIVRALGGEIEVTSKSGRGATFRVVLPPAGARAPEGSS